MQQMDISPKLITLFLVFYTQSLYGEGLRDINADNQIMHSYMQFTPTNRSEYKSLHTSIMYR